MATIRARKQSDGTTRYTAIVRIRKRKTIIYQEYKTCVLTRRVLVILRYSCELVLVVLCAQRARKDGVS